MARQINKNFKHLVKCYTEYTGAILEGSSRSGKTIASIDFIIWLSCNSEKKFILNIVRDTYNSFKTTLYLDFDKRLKDFGLVSPFSTSQEVASFKLFGNQINFIGADKPSKFEGAGADYWYFNELIDIDKIMFDLAEQRCRCFWWGDYNPKVTQHWVFDSILHRKDVAYLHSTFNDNPFISDIERNKIKSYEPNDFNNRQGTSDEFMWKVYGLGERCNREGLVFKKVTYIDNFPEDCEKITYGLDFGETAQTALIKAGYKSIDGKHNLYLKKLFYSPTENSSVVIDIVRSLGITSIIHCDNNMPGWVSDMAHAKLLVAPTTKFPGSREYWISTLNSFNIHIVKDNDFQKEQENFCYRVLNGVQLSETIHKFDHLWSASGYAVVGGFREFLIKQFGQKK